MRDVLRVKMRWIRLAPVSPTTSKSRRTLLSCDRQDMAVDHPRFEAAACNQATNVDPSSHSTICACIVAGSEIHPRVLVRSIRCVFMAVCWSRLGRWNVHITHPRLQLVSDTSGSRDLECLWLYQRSFVLSSGWGQHARWLHSLRQRAGSRWSAWRGCDLLDILE